MGRFDRFPDALETRTSIDSITLIRICPLRCVFGCRYSFSIPLSPVSVCRCSPYCCNDPAAADTPPEQAEQALVTTFDMLLEKRIVGKAAFATWYQGYKAKHDGGRPKHSIMLEFFKKRVLT